jgi:hypothetical protein
LVVTIRNVGAGHVSGGFRIAVWYRTPTTGPFTVQFLVPNNANPYYPNVVSGNIPIYRLVKNEHILSGKAIFVPTLRDVAVSLWAEVDACIGEEHMPSYCRVLESDEDNNKSGFTVVMIN